MNADKDSDPLTVSYVASKDNVNIINARGMQCRRSGAESGDVASPEQSQTSASNENCTSGDNCDATETHIPQVRLPATHDDLDAVPSDADSQLVQPQQEVSSSSASSIVVSSCTSLSSCTTGYFDIFVIHRQKDDRKILKLREILRKFVTLPDNRPLTFCLEEIGFPHIADAFEYFDKSLQHSRYKYIYISSGGCDADDDAVDGDDNAFQWKLYQHWALKDMINKKDASIVPVTDNPRTKVPTLLDIFRRLDIWKLLKRMTLDEVADVNQLSDDDIDVYTINFVRRMFDPNVLPTPRVYDTPQHIRLIQTNYRLLSEKLDLDNGLLSELYSKEVITHREMEAIKAEKTSYDRNEKLLNILRRKSEAKFQQFIVALRATNMAELAAVLEIQS